MLKHIIPTVQRQYKIKSGFGPYPFGSVMDWQQGAGVAQGRQYSYSAYRYGFNNQEKDRELGEYYSFEYRIHDARLGRFFSVDPLSKEYPWNSAYAFAECKSINSKELEGLEARPSYFASSVFWGFTIRAKSALKGSSKGSSLSGLVLDWGLTFESPSFLTFNKGMISSENVNRFVVELMFGIVANDKFSLAGSSETVDEPVMGGTFEKVTRTNAGFGLEQWRIGVKSQFGQSDFGTNGFTFEAFSLTERNIASSRTANPSALFGGTTSAYLIGTKNQFFSPPPTSGNPTGTAPPVGAPPSLSGSKATYYMGVRGGLIYNPASSSLGLRFGATSNALTLSRNNTTGISNRLWSFDADFDWNVTSSMQGAFDPSKDFIGGMKFTNYRWIR